MYVVTVRIQVVQERVAEFLDATLDNARNTRQEPGNVRFDVLRRVDDPSCFTLYEVYHDESGFKAHQQTAHYLKWKETVASMMAAPRIGEKHQSLFPDPWQ
jgi:autoinducer 2-degrading protein